MSSITTNEIELLFNLIIKKLRNDKVNEVAYEADEYWLISTDEWDDFSRNPEPVVGSIRDDIDYLKRAIIENDIHSYSEFDRMATVLRIISQVQSPI